jgi:hypothetical protein
VRFPVLLPIGVALRGDAAGNARHHHPRANPVFRETERGTESFQPICKTMDGVALVFFGQFHFGEFPRFELGTESV